MSVHSQGRGHSPPTRLCSISRQPEARSLCLESTQPHQALDDITARLETRTLVLYDSSNIVQRAPPCPKSHLRHSYLRHRTGRSHLLPVVLLLGKQVIHSVQQGRLPVNEAVHAEDVARGAGIDLGHVLDGRGVRVAGGKAVGHVRSSRLEEVGGLWQSVTSSASVGPMHSQPSTYLSYFLPGESATVDWEAVASSLLLLQSRQVCLGDIP